MYKKTKLSSKQKDIVLNRYPLVIAVMIVIMANACTPPTMKIRSAPALFMALIVAG